MNVNNGNYGNYGTYRVAGKSTFKGGATGITSAMTSKDHCVQGALKRIEVLRNLVPEKGTVTDYLLTRACDSLKKITNSGDHVMDDVYPLIEVLELMFKPNADVGRTAAQTCVSELGKSAGILQQL